jgi:hypothetical protein
MCLRTLQVSRREFIRKPEPDPNGPCGNWPVIRGLSALSVARLWATIRRRASTGTGTNRDALDVYRPGWVRASPEAHRLNVFIVVVRALVPYPRRYWGTADTILSNLGSLAGS